MPPSETSVSAMLYVLMLYLSRFPASSACLPSSCS